MFEYPNRNDVLKRHTEYVENESKKRELESGYYAINNTQKILLYSNECWYMPKKDRFDFFTTLKPVKPPKIKSLKKAILVNNRYFQIED
jgi:hypothetical protein